jgi:hypothetical protein
MSDLFQLKEISLKEWDIYWQRLPQANLLQAWQYGTAKEEAEGWRALRFLISDASGQPKALAQVLSRVLPFLGGAARLNRGPLFLEELPEEQIIGAGLGVLRALLREARRRRWWIVQMAPELPDTEAVCKGLKNLGGRRRPDPAWASGRLALTADEESILMGFHGKWRNCLRKGLRMDVLVTNHKCSGPEQDLLISHYSALQEAKDFSGLSPELIKSMARQQGADWQINLFIAREFPASDVEEPLGLLVTVRHGDSATYLIGTTNEKGRQMQANSVLLWHAILQAKHTGCAWFDIGGLSAATPNGIAKFKQGLNAVPYAVAGEWRWYLWGAWAKRA